jgi:hypothetical protein
MSVCMYPLGDSEQVDPISPPKWTPHAPKVWADGISISQRSSGLMHIHNPTATKYGMVHKTTFSEIPSQLPPVSQLETMLKS